MFKKSKLWASALILMGLPLTPVHAEVNEQAPSTFSSAPTLNPTQQNFLTMAVPDATAMANQNGLWTSIMLAQAIIESNWGTSQLGSAPNNNLFGMKANDSWTGRSVTYPTQEWDRNAQKYVTINAKFRAYDNYSASFHDNAEKLRFGLSWDHNYYSGTWLENTTNYQDAAQWLQGRYATSPTYANTLINAIKTYHLAQYDPQVENLTANGVINYYPNYGIKVYTSFAEGLKQETGALLQHGTPINVQQKITRQDGASFYRIGPNQWIPAEYAILADSPQEIAENGVVKIKYVPGYSIAVWDRATSDRQFTGQKLLHDTDWEYFAKYSINGTTWYQVGNHQWIDGTYVTKQPK